MSEQTNQAQRLIGFGELYAVLDRITMATMKVTAEQFVAGYPAGRFDAYDTAHHLSVLLPLLKEHPRPTEATRNRASSA